MKLTGKTALVTGGASGIGEACCVAMAREGASVAISDINDEAGNKLAETLKAEDFDVRFYHHDVTSEDDWATTVKAIIADFGGLNVVVNNAGMGGANTVEDCTLEQWTTMINVNQTSVFLGCREAVSHMKNNGGGSIINMCSVEGIVAESYAFSYNASKGAVRLLTKSAALHCGEQGYNIRVNSVHPAYVETELVKQVFAAEAPEFRSYVLGNHPIGRFGQVDDVAKGVVFLASDDSSYMTDSELVIDGGYTAQ